MKKFMFVICIILSAKSFSQVGIGTNAPEGSALLEVKSTNKGFLPPRVALTASNSASPITSPVEGLLVYNTVAAGTYPYNVVPGYYYWDGFAWSQMVTSTVDYGFVRYTGADTGPLSIGSNVALNASATGNLLWSSNQFTLKANKTYELEAYLAIYQAGGAVGGIFQIYNYSDNSVLASGLYISAGGGGVNNPSANGPMKAIITTTSDTQVGIRFNSFYGGGGGAPGLIGSTNFLGAYAAPNQCYFMVKQIGQTLQ